MERGKTLLQLYKQAKDLASEKVYDLDELGKKYASRKKAKYCAIGIGNGHKRSRKYEAFILEQRVRLKHDLHLCERAIQRILCYSNNFLHKKLKTDERGSRVVRQKGKAALGLLDPLESLGRRHCCVDQCVRMVNSHRNLLAQWRKRAVVNQSEARRVLAEMLTPSGGVRCNCYKFINWVTGCSMGTIGKVRDQMRRTKGDREPPQHGLYTFWEDKTHSRKHRAHPSATITSDPQSSDFVNGAGAFSDTSSLSDSSHTAMAGGSPALNPGMEGGMEPQRQQLLQLQNQLLQQQASISQQQQLVQQQIASQSNVQQINWSHNASNLVNIQQQVLQQMTHLHTAQHSLASTIQTLQQQLAALQPAGQHNQPSNPAVQHTAGALTNQPFPLPQHNTDGSQQLQVLSGAQQQLALLSAQQEPSVAHQHLSSGGAHQLVPVGAQNQLVSLNAQQGTAFAQHQLESNTVQQQLVPMAAQQHVATLGTQQPVLGLQQPVAPIGSQNFSLNASAQQVFVAQTEERLSNSQLQAPIAHSTSWPPAASSSEWIADDQQQQGMGANLQSVTLPQHSYQQSQVAVSTFTQQLQTAALGQQIAMQQPQSYQQQQQPGPYLQVPSQPPPYFAAQQYKAVNSQQTSVLQAQAGSNLQVRTGQQQNVQQWSSQHQQNVPVRQQTQLSGQLHSQAAQPVMLTVVQPGPQLNAPYLQQNQQQLLFQQSQLQQTQQQQSQLQQNPQQQMAESSQFQTVQSQQLPQETQFQCGSLTHSQQQQAVQQVPVTGTVQVLSSLQGEEKQGHQQLFRPPPYQTSNTSGQSGVAFDPTSEAPDYSSSTSQSTSEGVQQAPAHSATTLLAYQPEQMFPTPSYAISTATGNNHSTGVHTGVPVFQTSPPESASSQCVVTARDIEQNQAGVQLALQQGAAKQAASGNRIVQFITVNAQTPSQTQLAMSSKQQGQIDQGQAGQGQAVKEQTGSSQGQLLLVSSRAPTGQIMNNGQQHVILPSSTTVSPGSHQQTLTSAVASSGASNKTVQLINVTNTLPPGSLSSQRPNSEQITFVKPNLLTVAPVRQSVQAVRPGVQTVTGVRPSTQVPTLASSCAGAQPVLITLPQSMTVPLTQNPQQLIITGTGANPNTALLIQQPVDLSRLLLSSQVVPGGVNSVQGAISGNANAAEVAVSGCSGLKFSAPSGSGIPECERMVVSEISGLEDYSVKKVPRFGLTPQESAPIHQAQKPVKQVKAKKIKQMITEASFGSSVTSSPSCSVSPAASPASMTQGVWLPGVPQTVLSISPHTSQSVRPAQRNSKQQQKSKRAVMVGGSSTSAAVSRKILTEVSPSHHLVNTVASHAVSLVRPMTLTAPNTVKMAVAAQRSPRAASATVASTARPSTSSVLPITNLVNSLTTQALTTTNVASPLTYQFTPATTLTTPLANQTVSGTNLVATPLNQATPLATQTTSHNNQATLVTSKLNPSTPLTNLVTPVGTVLLRNGTTLLLTTPVQPTKDSVAVPSHASDAGCVSTSSGTALPFTTLAPDVLVSLPACTSQHAAQATPVLSGVNPALRSAPTVLLSPTNIQSKISAVPVQAGKKHPLEGINASSDTLCSGDVEADMTISSATDGDSFLAKGKPKKRKKAANKSQAKSKTASFEQRENEMATRDAVSGQSCPFSVVSIGGVQSLIPSVTATQRRLPVTVVQSHASNHAATYPQTIPVATTESQISMVGTAQSQVQPLAKSSVSCASFQPHSPNAPVPSTQFQQKKAVTINRALQTKTMPMHVLNIAGETSLKNAVPLQVVDVAVPTAQQSGVASPMAQVTDLPVRIVEATGSSTSVATSHQQNMIYCTTALTNTAETAAVGKTGKTNSATALFSGPSVSRVSAAASKAKNRVFTKASRFQSATATSLTGALFSTPLQTAASASMVPSSDTQTPQILSTGSSAALESAVSSPASRPWLERTVSTGFPISLARTRATTQPIITAPSGLPLSTTLPMSIQSTPTSLPVSRKVAQTVSQSLQTTESPASKVFSQKAHTSQQTVPTSLNTPTNFTAVETNPQQAPPVSRQSTVLSSKAKLMSRETTALLQELTPVLQTQAQGTTSASSHATPAGFPVSVTPVGEGKKQMMCITSLMTFNQLQVLLSSLKLPVGSMVQPISSPVKDGAVSAPEEADPSSGKSTSNTLPTQQTRPQYPHTSSSDVLTSTTAVVSAPENQSQPINVASAGRIVPVASESFVVNDSCKSSKATSGISDTALGKVGQKPLVRHSKGPGAAVSVVSSAQTISSIQSQHTFSQASNIRFGAPVSTETLSAQNVAGSTTHRHAEPQRHQNSSAQPQFFSRPQPDKPCLTRTPAGQRNYRPATVKDMISSQKEAAVPVSNMPVGVMEHAPVDKPVMITQGVVAGTSSVKESSKSSGAIKSFKWIRQNTAPQKFSAAAMPKSESHRTHHNAHAEKSSVTSQPAFKQSGSASRPDENFRRTAGREIFRGDHSVSGHRAFEAVTANERASRVSDQSTNTGASRPSTAGDPSRPDQHFAALKKNGAKTSTHKTTSMSPLSQIPRSVQASGGRLVPEDESSTSNTETSRTQRWSETRSHQTVASNTSTDRQATTMVSSEMAQTGSSVTPLREQSTVTLHTLTNVPHSFMDTASTASRHVPLDTADRHGSNSNGSPHSTTAQYSHATVGSTNTGMSWTVSMASTAAASSDNSNSSSSTTTLVPVVPPSLATTTFFSSASANNHGGLSVMLNAPYHRDHTHTMHYPSFDRVLTTSPAFMAHASESDESSRDVEFLSNANLFPFMSTTSRSRNSSGASSIEPSITPALLSYDLMQMMTQQGFTVAAVDQGTNDKVT
ncbi:streptococcal hemagglutinin-like [Littorina saxatilis]